jgi:uncharacterized RDD family membrane protein YckC
MNGTRTNNLTISTPEGISFSLLLAGPITRFFAWSIDLACISLISSLVSRFLFGLNIINPDIAMAVITLVYFVVSIGYGILLEWYWRGQTLGKRLLRLRVVDEEGLHLRFHQVVIRNLLRFIDGLPLFYLVGGVSCALSSRSQRLGDIAAGTVVTRTRSGSLYKLDEIDSEKYNSFRDYPHMVARLRQRATPELTLLALQAVERRENFEPTARIELFKDIANYFKSLVSFPEDAIFGLTDEQYVRNIIDSLFQKQWQKSSDRQPAESKGFAAR